ncbi:MAG: Crp/Fnr family transcriptional regulator [Bacteroidales bacterium]|nr:Crp/Fnr family transcriptional regulator [Bacteroidales bacterium]HOA09975.1 Crp/Fnr family transcriptional regulator [Tenuifilaceae bacterium]MBP8643784.1 Crp/Fnr family transcriptional regulator [Bacteroidales bacterium]NLI88532.1 Crp/Fnr family transcriptional regulator [Bacteroidales bacterium]HOC36869.1 Crp/Fnr family transcriptional regulator [Tenuifilaceae bacterium]
MHPNINKNEFKWLRRISMKFINRRDFIRIERSSVSLAFKKGETILKQGEQPSHVVYLERGIVKFSYQNEAGKNLILTIVAAPKILGGANLFYKDNNLFSFVAVDDCDVVLIDAQVLLSVMENNAKFSIMLFQLASGMFKKSILNFISLAYKQKEGRIADIIIYLSAEVYNSRDFTLTLTRRELAEFAGCSTENVIMTLSKWQNENVIAAEGKQLQIIDMERLKHISKIA